MKTSLLLVASGIFFALATATALHADQVVMQNGDHYTGKVLSMSADTVMLESEVLGKINVPRKNVASLLIGTNAAAPKAVATLPLASPAAAPPVAAPAPTTALANTNVDLSAALRNLGANTNFVQQIREQMLSTSPEANKQYSEMINGLATGQLNLNDIRARAKSSADQLRAYKKELGPEADDALDMYLEVLDNFLKETASEPVVATPAPSPKIQR
ncbi:MAG: hypothetical protein QOD03_1304 [Verrucomicrobiota bacterium]|jgi:hypothetical protein